MDQNVELATLRSLVEAESNDGRALVRDIEHNPICSISLDKEIPCIVVRWKSYSTPSATRIARIMRLRSKNIITRPPCRNLYGAIFAPDESRPR